MITRILRRVIKAITDHPLLLSFGLISLSAAAQIAYYGNEFGFDAYSEATSYQSAINYEAEGFLSHYGLANWGGKQAEIVVKRFPERSTIVDDDIYIGNPPGPDIMIWGFLKLFGPGRLMLYRCCLLAIGLMALYLLYIALVKWFGLAKIKSAIVVLLIGICNPFRIWMVSLHYQGYGMVLLVAQVALSIMLVGSGHSHKWKFTFFFLLGFAQGAVRYDFVFLTWLAPVVIGLLVSIGRPLVPKRFIVAAVLSGVGFVAADFAYLLAVTFHSGGFDSLVTKFYERTVGANSRIAIDPSEMSITSLFQEYLQKSSFFKLGFLFDIIGISLLIAIFHLTARGLCLTVGPSPLTRVREIVVSANKNHGLSLVAASLAGWGWVFMFRQHAFFHSWLLYVHFFLVYIVLVISIVKSSTLRSTE